MGTDRPLSHAVLLQWEPIDHYHMQCCYNGNRQTIITCSVVTMGTDRPLSHAVHISLALPTAT